MQDRRPDIISALTGCFDSVPSTTFAHDGTPLSMTAFFLSTNRIGMDRFIRRVKPCKFGKPSAGSGP